eukprot:3932621-Rhodomonas_salina.1
MLRWIILVLNFTTPGTQVLLFNPHRLQRRVRVSEFLVPGPRVPYVHSSGKGPRRVAIAAAAPLASEQPPDPKLGLLGVKSGDQTAKCLPVFICVQLRL